MPEYDFYATVRSDLEQLQKELAAEGVGERIDALVGRFGVSRDLALAAIWRSSRRHGETLAVFVNELAEQDQRTAARAQDTDAGSANGANGVDGAASTNTPQVGDTAPRL